MANMSKYCAIKVIAIGIQLNISRFQLRCHMKIRKIVNDTPSCMNKVLHFNRMMDSTFSRLRFIAFCLLYSASLPAGWTGRPTIYIRMPRNPNYNGPENFHFRLLNLPYLGVFTTCIKCSCFSSRPFEGVRNEYARGSYFARNAAQKHTKKNSTCKNQFCLP